eukprot:TRINITY_DN3213_c0_g1_i1.p1 TRINITY_DN3213_c0_g1~~TRINITY_DN3213_c0_g1_i1.p1  ORF type:complete len:259 (+),score=68.45 TRINITY_DN3213_c0_g1_i1:3-779(+)
MARRLEGKIVLVTGAGGAIGREIAIECARQGAIVEIADLNGEEGQKTVDSIQQELKQDVSFFTKLNVSVEEDIKNWVAGVVQRRGRIDVLVNNAAIWVWGDIAKVSDEDWNRILGINVKGYAFCIKHVVPHMIKQNGGSIVNMASISGFIAQADMVAYSATKGAILQMTRNVALDYGAHSIRCNSICPGFIDTPISRTHCQKLNMEWETFVKEGLKSSFLPRPGSTHDVAMGVVFLASNESTYITGATLPIDGGYLAK